ncbi:zinc finger, CCHC-type containing protein [Tanacetum coccineum]
MPLWHSISVPDIPRTLGADINDARVEEHVDSLTDFPRLEKAFGHKISLQWSAYFAQHVFALWSVVHKKDLQNVLNNYAEKLWIGLENFMFDWLINADMIVSQVEYPSLVDLSALFLDLVAQLLGALSRPVFSYLIMLFAIPRFSSVTERFFMELDTRRIDTSGARSETLSIINEMRYLKLGVKTEGGLNASASFVAKANPLNRAPHKRKSELRHALCNMLSNILAPLADGGKDKQSKHIAPRNHGGPGAAPLVAGSKGRQPLAGSSWQKKMHFLLTTLKVVYVLSTPSPVWSENETLETTRKRMKWENDDYICRGHILNGMSDSLFDIYQNAESAKALRESLESKYMAEDDSAKKFLVSNFMNYKMVDTRPVMEQYHEMLRILGQYTQHNLMMDEAISVAVIIDKLPPSWKEFKHDLKHKKKELNLVQLGSHLRIEEGLRNSELDNNPKGKNQIGSSSVNMVEGD